VKKKILLVSAVLLLAAPAALLRTAPAAATSACTDSAYNQLGLTASMDALGAGTDSMLEQWASAKAEAMRAVREMRSTPIPCNRHLRAARAHWIASYLADYRSYAAGAAGNKAQASRWSRVSSHESDLAGAQEAMGP
jgi:hypothetical protein